VTQFASPASAAAAVRGSKHVVKTGKTPVLDANEWRKLINSIPTETVRDLRDRALIAPIVAIMRKLLILANALLRDDGKWTLELA
jgi:hypothetical protein